MKRVFQLISLVCFVGCKGPTPMELIESPEAVTFTTRRTVEEAVIFITQEWSKHTAAISVTPIPGGSLVSKVHRSGGTSMCTAKIWAEGGKTYIRYKTAYPTMGPDYLVPPFVVLQNEPTK